MITEFVSSIDSTNTYLFKKALSGEFREERAICADMQTAGKGRKGRSFFSPDRTGLYLSILLFPKCTVEEAKKITTLMAVASAKAIKEVIKKDVGIKWVNDLYLSGKKISGILTECSPDINDGIPSFVVTGIGINILKPEGGFPEDIADRAGALFEEAPEDHGDITDIKRRLAERMIAVFKDYYAGFPDTDFTDEYRSLSVLTGKRVKIADGPEVTVCGIEDDLGLRVRYDDGTEEVLTAGEVSLII
ncbi:MAG: biotin--[acetyl-CoA-carboxylase] ligase [Lachnospiraceae bacterium]|nr:biotin--[acetyl-CoA-carboxylase] ligase [Lachnospiraceae bacterium]